VCAHPLGGVAASSARPGEGQKCRRRRRLDAAEVGDQALTRVARRSPLTPTCDSHMQITSGHATRSRRARYDACDLDADIEVRGGRSREA